jgi:hypothetical protein
MVDDGGKEIKKPSRHLDASAHVKSRHLTEANLAGKRMTFGLGCTPTLFRLSLVYCNASMDKAPYIGL